LVDLAEDYNAGEFCLGVVGNLRVESEDAHAAAILSGDILVRFLDEHCGGVDVDVRYELSAGCMGGCLK
jgi:hypothetical protein